MVLCYEGNAAQETLGSEVTDIINLVHGIPSIITIQNV
jgi:hypothetical protein